MKEPDDQRDAVTPAEPGPPTGGAAAPAAGEAVTDTQDTTAPSRTGPDAERRPLIERLGMAAIAIVLAVLFGVVAVAAFTGGEPFLGAMGAIGCLMTLWVGGLTLLRG